MLTMFDFSSVMKSLDFRFRQKSRKRRTPFGTIDRMEDRKVPSATSITVIGSSGSNTYQFNTGTSQFNSPVSGTGGGTAMADFNGDGLEDLVSLNRGHLISFGFFSAPSQLSISLNNGAGGFGGATVWDANIPLSPSSGGSTWADIKVGNFGGDSKADVLMRNKETGEWDLWTTNNTGTGFTKTVFGTWDTGVQWRDALTGDFNGDGLMDLVGRRVANEPVLGGAAPTAVDQWYVGLGTASAINRGVVGAVGNTWWNYAKHLHSDVVTNVVVGNFDGDVTKRDDLAIRFAGATAADGSRPSQWKIATSGASGSAVVDLNLVANNAWATNWNHALANGAQQHWRDVQAGDVNGDGKDDILGRTESGKWYLSLGGTAASTPATLVADWSTNGLATQPTVVGDYAGAAAKKLDLVVWNPSAFQWYRSVYSGTTFTTPTAAGGMTFGGAPDRKTTFVNGSSAGYSTYLGHRGELGSSAALALLEDISRWKGAPGFSGTDPALTIGRYNTDGSFDFEDYGGGVVSPTPMSAGNGAGGGYRADFDGDGLQDLLSQGFNPTSPGQWYLSKNIGNAFVTSAINTIPQSWAVATKTYVADFTGDGKSDFLVMVQDSSTMAHWDLYVSTGTGFNAAVSVATMSSTTNDGWMTQGGTIGDFDGDGKDDFTIELQSIGTPGTYRTYVAYSNGTAGWTIAAPWSRVDTTVVGGTHLFFIENSGDRVRVGDVNGDGRDDVLGLQNLNGMVTSTGQVWVGLSSATRGVSGGSGSWLNLPAAFDFSAPKDRHVFEVGRFVGTAGVQDTKADIVINPSDNIALLRVYGSTGTAFGPSAAFTGPLSAGFAAGIRPLVGDVDRDTYDDLVWSPSGVGGFTVSLMVRTNLPLVVTPNTGAIGVGPNYYGQVTTINRLRRRRG